MSQVQKKSKLKYKFCMSCGGTHTHQRPKVDCARFRVASLQVLLKSRADPSLKDGSGYTSIHHAARHGQHEMLRLMLEEAQVQILSMDDNFLSWYNKRHPIQLACEANCLKSFQLLLEELERRDGETCQGESEDPTKKEQKNSSQKDLLKTIFESRPQIAACLLERSGMRVVQELLKGREKSWVLQLLRNSAKWVFALDHLVKEPESLVSSLPRIYYDQRNGINFWNQNFTNHWNGMAYLAAETRTVRHSPKVLCYLGDPRQDFKDKKELLTKLKGTASFAELEEVHVSIGLCFAKCRQLPSVEAYTRMPHE